MNNSTEMITINDTSNNFLFIWKHVVFGLYLFGQLMSIPCYVFMFYHLLATKTARETLQNHAIILILIFNFVTLTIDVSMIMDDLRRGITPQLTPALCLFHQYVSYSFWCGALFLMLWTSIERHILIFHSMLVATARGRLLFHYIPLAIFALYAPILYFYLIFLYPCQHVFVATDAFCGGPCYYSEVSGWYILYDSLVNCLIPILIIVVFGVALILRVIIQKRRLQQANKWRQRRKMILQLILVFCTYLVFDLPYIIIIIVRWAGIPDFGSNVYSPYIAQLTYVPAIILPYATLVILAGVKQKLRALVICKYNRRAIAPLSKRP